MKGVNMGKNLLIAFLFLIVLTVIGCEQRDGSGVIVYSPEGKGIKSEYNGIYYDKPAYNFCLKTQENGREKTLCLKDMLREKDIVLLFFGYTHCPDVCPAAMYVLQKTVNKLDKEARNRIQVVFISVDPERDTPDKVSQYAEYFNEDFIGLTGTPEEIKQVAKAYKVFYQKVKNDGSEGYLVDHTALIYLITKDEKIKLIYSVSKQKPELMAKDIKKLLD